MTCLTRCWTCELNSLLSPTSSIIVLKLISPAFYCPHEWKSRFAVPELINPSFNRVFIYLSHQKVHSHWLSHSLLFLTAHKSFRFYFSHVSPNWLMEDATFGIFFFFRTFKWFSRLGKNVKKLLVIKKSTTNLSFSVAWILKGKLCSITQFFELYIYYKLKRVISTVTKFISLNK